jgi:hypothetical protein
LVPYLELHPEKRGGNQTGNKEVSTLNKVETHLEEAGWGVKAGTYWVGRVDFQSKIAIVNKNFT